MEEKKKLSRINISDARLIFRNFRGLPGPYNKNGVRNFCVVLDDLDLADRLAEDGWKIKVREPREEGEDKFVYMPVAVRFDNYPPDIYVIANGRKTKLDEESVEMLDYADIKCADLVITPYNWTMDGRTGVKAYLYAAYITIDENPFAEKYAHLDGDDIPF